MSSNWFRDALFQSKISHSNGFFGVVPKTNKQVSQTFIHDHIFEV